MSKYFKLNNSTILYLNSSYNCIKNSSITLTKTSGGTGYTSAPNITITPASGDMGTNATATCTVSGGTISTVTMTYSGSNYNTLPTITLSGGGTPGSVTGYSALVGGSGYALPPSLSLSGGGGSGFTGYTTLTATSISATFTITNGGTGYVTGDSIVFNNTATGGGSGAIATVTATAGVITAINLTNGGTGYTLKAPTITVTSAAGTGAVITCALVATSIGSLVITNGGSNYSTAPSFVFTPTSGGTGASATPTITVGTAAVLTPSFLRTYSYSWIIPEIVINDFAKVSAINIVATGFTTSTPYSYRIADVIYDSRDTFFSDYGNPILSIAQNVNVCSYGSLGGTNFAIILTPQVIRKITVLVDDDITNKGSGQLSTINFIMALNIDEYDPVMTQIGDVYSESASRLKLQYGH